MLFFKEEKRERKRAKKNSLSKFKNSICGAVLGGYLNKITPTWLTTTLLAVLLTAMAVKLAMRARAAWELVRDERRRARLVAIEGGGRERLLLQEGETDDGEVDEEEFVRIMRKAQMF